MARSINEYYTRAHTELGHFHYLYIQDCYVDEDPTMLTTVARSLQKLEATFGAIPNVKAKGPQAALALHRFLGLKRQRLVRREQQQQGVAEPDGAGDGGASGPALRDPPEIDTLVILDRAVDLVTPLLTPLTYEGVIDEFIGIHNGAIKVDPSLIGDE